MKIPIPREFACRDGRVTQVDMGQRPVDEQPGSFTAWFEWSRASVEIVRYGGACVVEVAYVRGEGDGACVCVAAAVVVAVVVVAWDSGMATRLRVRSGVAYGSSRGQLERACICDMSSGDSSGPHHV